MILAAFAAAAAAAAARLLSLRASAAATFSSRVHPVITLISFVSGCLEA